MKLPEPLFAVINPTMKLLLRSPLHFVLSRSIMLITFTGRKSGRRFTTPVRYMQDGNTVRCFSSAESRWWRNLRGGADVELRVRGVSSRFHATAIDADPAAIRHWFSVYLQRFPQDAAYHDVRLNRDRTPAVADFEQALQHAVLVEATPAGTV